MGFTAGIYSYPKYNNSTPDDIFGVESYLNYDTNTWAKDKFKSAEEYCQYRKHQTPSKEMIDFYRDFWHTDEYGQNSITTELASWCSNGIWLYNILKSYFETNVLESPIILTKEIVELLLYKIIGMLCENKFEVANISNSFTFVDNDNAYESDILLKHCDGVELTFDDNTMRREVTNENFDNGIITIKNNVDYDVFLSEIEAVKCLVNILQTVDFETTVIFYSGGW